MKMREIIKNVAELISNLQILNIIKKKGHYHYHNSG